jgi:hypothetical protein
MGRELALAFAVPFAIYVAWRLGCFGKLLPNSAACKAGYSADPWALVRELAILCALPLGLAALGGRALLRPAPACALAITALYAIVLYDVDPVIGYGGRHGLAAFALLGVPAALGLARLGASARTPVGAYAPVVALALAIASATFVADVPGRMHEHAARYAARAAARTRTAAVLRQHLAPGERAVLGDVGLVGWLVPDLGIVDAYCLNHPAMSAGTIGRSADEFAEHTMAQRPAAIVVTSRSAARCDPRSRRMAALLEHPDFAAYRLVAVEGAEDDEFHAFVYVRDRPPLPAGAPPRDPAPLACGAPVR